LPNPHPREGGQRFSTAEWLVIQGRRRRFDRRKLTRTNEIVIPAKAGIHFDLGAILQRQGMAVQSAILWLMETPGYCNVQASREDQDGSQLSLGWRFIFFSPMQNPAQLHRRSNGPLNHRIDERVGVPA
jgi:hypothetical protein